jgi:RNA polymerase sigma factor (sigma-70 family)
VFYYEKPQAGKMTLMEMMTEVRRIEKEIERREDNIKRLDAQKYRCTSSISGMPHGGQKPDWYDIDAEIESIEQQISELRRKHGQLISDMDACDEANMLENDEYFILKYKYISGYTNEAIAEAMEISPRTVSRRLKSASEKIAIN